jgi:4-amino-4-deoxy-L-arabinose transferase-like glycosyltransferase
METPSPDVPRRRDDLLVVGALMLLAAAIRLYRLGDWSLWADEVFTVRDALQFPAVLTINPIPYACVAGTIRLFGVSEWSVRLVPALVGTLCVPVVAFIGGRLFERRTGRLAALFVAVSPWHVFWSQNARHYVFTFLFAAIAALAFFEGFERNDFRCLVGSWVGVVGLALAHALSGALVLGFAGYTVVVRILRQRFGWSASRRTFIIVYFAPFVIAFGVVLAFPALREHLVSGWGHNLWARDALYIAATFAFGVTLPVAGVAAIGWLTSESNATHARAVVFLACAVALPFAFFLASSLVQNVAGYYLFFVTPFVFVLAGRGCAICIEGRRRLVGWTATVAVVASSLTGDVAYFTTENGGREDWKGAFAELAPTLMPDDRVLMLLPDVGSFYLPATRFERITLDDISVPDRIVARPTNETYVVVDAKAFATLDPTGQFRRWVDAHGHRVVRRAVFARTSDRSVEIFRLDVTSKGTRSLPR